MPISDRPCVLLINPPVYDFALYDLFMKPMGLINLGDALHRRGFDVRMVNALDWRDEESMRTLKAPRRRSNGTGKFFRQPVASPEHVKNIQRRFARYGITSESLSARIAAIKPDIILVGSTMTYWYKGVEEIIRLCRRLHPGVPIAVGGIYASLMPEHCRSVTAPDFVVKGDAFPQLDTVLQKSGLGGSFADSAAKRGATVTADLSSENELAAEWIGFLKAAGLEDASVLRLNNGCPMRCRYCASSLLCPTFRPGDPQQAFEQFRFQFDTLGIRHFGFYDDALLINSDMVFIPFLEKVAASGRKASFYLPNALHIRYLAADILGLMKRTGFQEIRMGYESSSSDFHARYDAKYSRDEFSNALRMIREAGFAASQTAVYILTGLPGQLRDEVEESIHCAGNMGARIYLARYSPVPGSALWQESVRFSALPIETNPVYQNNTFFPMEWERFTRKDLGELEQLSLDYRKKNV